MSDPRSHPSKASEITIRSAATAQRGTNLLSDTYTASVDDRPRERLEASGSGALSDAELIALVLRTGDRHNDALVVASELLNRHGGLRRISQANGAELARSPGIGPAKSASILAALEIGRRIERRKLVAGTAMRGPVDIFRHFQPNLRDLRQERFAVVLLDARHRVMRTEVVSQGTLTASLVHPREVFRPALRDAAAALVLVHNHPSGDPTPSREDREVTIRLSRAGEILGVRVLDHVILAERGYCSLREEGVLPPAADFANPGPYSQLGLFSDIT
jgi:DNA repair protein RadC